MYRDLSLLLAALEAARREVSRQVRDTDEPANINAEPSERRMQK